MTENFMYTGEELEMFGQAKNWKQYMTGFINPHIKGKVLEVGAGLGMMTSLMNLETDQEWILLEPDKKMSLLLQEKIATGTLKENCIVINGTIDNVEGLLFDTIIYIDVLEHIEYDSAEIKKATNLLRSGGKLIILCPAFQFLFSPFDKAIGHYRRYSKKSMQAIIQTQLKNELLQYLDTAGFFSSLANRLLLWQKYPSQKQIFFWDRFLIPASILLDKIFFFSFGKSILGIWEK